MSQHAWCKGLSLYWRCNQLHNTQKSQNNILYIQDCFKGGIPHQPSPPIQVMRGLQLRRPWRSFLSTLHVIVMLLITILLQILQNIAQCTPISSHLSLASSYRKTLHFGRTSSWLPTPGTSSSTWPPTTSSIGWLNSRLCDFGLYTVLEVLLHLWPFWTQIQTPQFRTANRNGQISEHKTAVVKLLPTVTF